MFDAGAVGGWAGRVRHATAPPTIRPARPGDLVLLPAIEASGDSQFRLLAMDVVADAAPSPAGAYAEAAAAGRVWVAVDAEDAPVGFARVEIVDGTPHLEQLSVAPGHQRRGVGAGLLGAAAAWTRAHGHQQMTLRTFRDVPFNGPYYARLGWRVLPDALAGPELAALRRNEERHGLLRWPRQAMVLDLGSEPSERDAAPSPASR